MVHKGNSFLPLQTCAVTRSGYDPQAIEVRQPMTLDQNDLKHLAAQTNGRSGILHNPLTPKISLEIFLTVHHTIYVIYVSLENLELDQPIIP